VAIVFGFMSYLHKVIPTKYFTRDYLTPIENIQNHFDIIIKFSD
jgi:hypothetical protein